MYYIYLYNILLYVHARNVVSHILDPRVCIICFTFFSVLLSESKLHALHRAPERSTTTTGFVVAPGL